MPAPRTRVSYFRTFVNPGDSAFNQELGINNSGLIAGYFGSGAAGTPNKGYTTAPPYTSFTNENFPGSMQTQVTGLNNSGTTVGFWSNTDKGVGMDSNFGFTDVGGVFTNVNNPATATAAPVVTNQLLGVNDSDIAVGFYVDAADNTYGYTYNIATKTFSANINDPNGMGATTATAIKQQRRDSRVLHRLEWSDGWLSLQWQHVHYAGCTGSHGYRAAGPEQSRGSRRV